MIQTGIIAVTAEPTTASWHSLGGAALSAAAPDHGLRVTAEALVSPSRDQLANTLTDFSRQGCRVILVTGGTGVGPEDITPETVRSLSTCGLPAFGETLRRHLPPEAVFTDRSLAVVLDQSLVIALPDFEPDMAGFLEVLAPGIRQVLRRLT